MFYILPVGQRVSLLARGFNIYISSIMITIFEYFSFASSACEQWVKIERSFPAFFIAYDKLKPKRNDKDQDQYRMFGDVSTYLMNSTSIPSIRLYLLFFPFTYLQLIFYQHLETE